MNKQTINKMRNANCSYPGCDKKQVMSCGITITKLTESGQMIATEDNKEQGISVGVPFCSYHSTLAMQGLFAVVEEKGNMVLNGAFPIIEIAEAVFNAKEMEKSIKEKEKSK